MQQAGNTSPADWSSAEFEAGTERLRSEVCRRLDGVASRFSGNADIMMRDAEARLADMGREVSKKTRPADPAKGITSYLSLVAIFAAVFVWLS